MKKPFLVKWYPPSENTIKLNIDDASRDNTRPTVCGGVFRNYNSDIILACSDFLGVDDTNNRVDRDASFTHMPIIILSIRHDQC